MEVSGPVLFPPTLLGRQDGEGATSWDGKIKKEEVPFQRSVEKGISISRVKERHHCFLQYLQRSILYCSRGDKAAITKHLNTNNQSLDASASSSKVKNLGGGLEIRINTVVQKWL
ncbi:hypothetical protein TNCV_4863731 [Trichonephila clavipes]|nr:hypothetical protein TNCV_4863731 [Trichonephila clavipes]